MLHEFTNYLRWERRRSEATVTAYEADLAQWLLYLEHAMVVHTVSGPELNQDVGRAKRAAEDGPVVITDRGRPSHVLLSWTEYQRMSGGPRNLAAVLAGPAL